MVLNLYLLTGTYRGVRGYSWAHYVHFVCRIKGAYCLLIHDFWIVLFNFGLTFNAVSTGNYNYETGSMTGILGQLKWEFLKKRRKNNRLILLCKGLKGKASVPTDDLIPKTRRCRNQHPIAFQTPCGGRKRSPRTSTIVQFIFYFGPLRSAIIFWEIRNKWSV